jgi:hypothetical protein
MLTTNLYLDIGILLLKPFASADSRYILKMSIWPGISRANQNSKNQPNFMDAIICYKWGVFMNYAFNSIANIERSSISGNFELLLVN